MTFRSRSWTVVAEFGPVPAGYLVSCFWRGTICRREETHRAVNCSLVRFALADPIWREAPAADLLADREAVRPSTGKDDL